MKILVTIPHFYHPGGAQGSLKRSGGYSSVGEDATPKINALHNCLMALLANFGNKQFTYKYEDRMLRQPADRRAEISLEIMVVTTRLHHVLERVGISKSAYEHVALDVEPAQLGFECHRLLGERRSAYDYYCYLEDDIIINDPLIFKKLGWFSHSFGDDRLLQPNRYELAVTQAPYPEKHYIDFEYTPWTDKNTSFVHSQPTQEILRGSIFQEDVIFSKARNLHSGCFFLNESQLSEWINTPVFPDRDSTLFNPMDSAATLGLIKHFHLYKPAAPYLNFLEVLHHGESWTDKIMSVRFR